MKENWHHKVIGLVKLDGSSGATAATMMMMMSVDPKQTFKTDDKNKNQITENCLYCLVDFFIGKRLTHTQRVFVFAGVIIGFRERHIKNGYELLA